LSSRCRKPSQFEAMFVSLAHTDEDIDRTIAVVNA
jgi:glutamate-1-semialdehyde aminotransferase